jgi:hypothetical protein
MVRASTGWRFLSGPAAYVGLSTLRCGKHDLAPSKIVGVAIAEGLLASGKQAPG